MINVPGFIVGLWFLPMMLNIVLPLVMLACWLVMQVPAKLGAQEKSQDNRSESVSEKRTCRRVHASDLRVDVSDGVERLSGLACNISQMGICIWGLPEKVFSKAERLTIIMEEKGTRFSFDVLPKWETIMESGKRIGARIDSAPEGWLEFVEVRESY